MASKELWKLLKPFLANKGSFSEDQIRIEIENEFVTDERVLRETFNENNIKIVEKNSGIKPSSLEDLSNLSLDQKTVEKVIEKYCF